MPMQSLKKKSSSDTTEPIAGGNKGAHTFLIGVSPKVNVKTRLGFELA